MPYCSLYDTCLNPYGAITKALIMFCGQEWTEIANALLRQYSHFVVVFSDDFYEEEKGGYRYALRTRITNILEHGGYYNVSFYNNHTVLTMGPQAECLSCENSALRSRAPLRITRQVPLEGQELRVYCLHPYICESPTFSVLVDTLRHRKANVTTFPVDKDSENKRQLAEAFLISSVNALVYNPTPEVRKAIRIPEVIIPAYYDSFSYSVFAKRRHSLPKQAVLFLPFTWKVWLSLTVAMSACIVTMKLIQKFGTRSKACYARCCAGHTFAALLLHQSCQLPRALKGSTPARLVVGLWALLVVVMSTGFKASLTSLLRDVPLEGSPLTFTSLGDVTSHGYRYCWLTYAGDDVTFSLGAYAPIKRIGRICVSSDGKVLHMDNSRVVYLMHSPSIRTHEVFTQQLYSNDYAPLPQKISPYLSGPCIRTNSRYRDAITSTIVQAFESGLFQRQLSLQEYENLRTTTNDMTTSPKILGLSFGDLKGCVCVFMYGSGIATVVLLIELSLHIVHSLLVPFRNVPQNRLLFYKRKMGLKKQFFTFQLQEIHVSHLWTKK
ncbi:hypothetical protein HPB50_014050 [Hyalomma asiaticum]|uniref:Uncharacterized protein n=1 Tax=Hyalomma asiaticum TaxID=266040 RepID=A0ACB7SYB7_HYAAI|nr:hypothetical protein HPB50_014050 [Hyalomma asiaticum]